ncbi:Uncharacterised protein [Yersinia pekkanenii]|uniref:Uncharacterized protein n=1 Tax=Yersinia pekkanenii TaxID=1288385 RepID=A0A0T9PQL5_9GAMM|nr:Uncharacterised protein [Yersinia pekkanenii]CRY68583.1 Uncharacterised protein [Yersinia pekkanenii]
MSQSDCIGKTLKPWPVFVDHYRYRARMPVNTLYQLAANPGLLAEKNMITALQAMSQPGYQDIRPVCAV